MSHWPGFARWLTLAALSVVLIAALSLTHLAAALLLGAMAAAVICAASHAQLRIPGVAMTAAQALIGCMIAQALRPGVWSTLAQHWPEQLAGVLSVVLASYGSGWCLMRLKILPGTTALWGSSPGAASAMIFIAEAYGEDIRLVAFMLYLRVVLVAASAALVAHLWLPVALSHAAASPLSLWAPVHARAALASVALAWVAAWVGVRSRMPAGGLLLPLICGLLVQHLGWLQIELPRWLLALSYLLIGWSIGLRFTRSVLLYAAKAVPGILLATVILLLVCAGIARLLTRFAGIDPVTAYLATSPGGADSIAIIAASSTQIDTPFVMAMQMARFMVVLLIGPSLARLLAGRKPDSATTSV